MYGGWRFFHKSGAYLLPERPTGAQGAQAALERRVSFVEIAADEKRRHDVGRQVKRDTGEFVIHTANGQDAERSSGQVVVEIVVPKVNAGAAAYIPFETFDGADREVVLVSAAYKRPAIPGVAAITSKSLNSAGFADEVFERNRRGKAEAQTDGGFVRRLGLSGHEAADDKGESE